MDMQVLVAAVDKDVDALAGQMNLETEAVIVNQCDSFGYREYLHKGKRIRCFSMKERGVGLNRNTALMHAGREILLFSDEDIVLYPGYHRTVLKAFEENPDADIITFNFKVDPTRATYYNKKKRRIRWYNYGRYPTYAAAARRESLLKANVSFSLLFGGGARYSNGEDSLFLKEFMDKGYKVYTAPVTIAREIGGDSTWFKGYDEKFFRDRGVLYRQLYGRLHGLMALRFLLAHREKLCGEVPLKQAYRWMMGAGKNCRSAQ